MRRRHDAPLYPATHPAARIVGRVVPAVFGLIGLSVIVFLWSAPFDEFGSPPLFFRVFGSLIGGVFVLVGFSGAVLGPQMRRGRTRGRGAGSSAGSKGGGYTCPNCGAGLGKGADVSPSGDVRCSFCERWFNIHRDA